MIWYTTNTLKTMETDHGQSICALTKNVIKWYFHTILNMNKELHSQLIRCKKDIVGYYRKHKCFHYPTIEWFASVFSTHREMIKALSFMKHEINKNEFTSRDFEEIYNK